MANKNIGTMVSATKEIDLTTFSLRKGNGPGGEYISTFVKSVEDGKSEYEEYLNIINSSRHFIKTSTYINGLIQVLILSTHKSKDILQRFTCLCKCGWKFSIFEGSFTFLSLKFRPNGLIILNKILDAAHAA